MFIETYPQKVKEVTPENVATQRVSSKSSLQIEPPQLIVCEYDRQDSGFQRGTIGERECEWFSVEKIKSDQIRQLAVKQGELRAGV